MRENLIANLTSRAHCPYCGDDGQVTASLGVSDELLAEWFQDVKDKTEKTVDGKKVVDRKLRRTLLSGLPAYGEQMGPCPKCERGNVLEFPPGDKPGPWGPEGFWRGRDPELQVRDDTVAPPPPEVKQWLEKISVKEMP